MSEGFRVDLYALHQAAEGITRVVDAVVTHPIAASTANADALGHADLAAAVEEFAGRWQLGVESLADGGRAAATDLTGAAAAYERSDVAAGHTVDGILGATSGPDPAGG